MVLPTRVNIINDFNKTIKVKIDNDRDRHLDEIINIEPGSRLDGIEGSVSGSGKFDVIVDIIINPAGPDNNTRLGGFKFHNPFIGSPYVGSDEFTTLDFDYRQRERFGDLLPYDYRLTSQAGRENTNAKRKRYWGKLDSGLLDQEKSLATNRALLVNAAPKPTFTIEAFFDDDAAGAKEWDLRINSNNFTL